MYICRSQINQWMTEVPPLGVEREIQVDGDIFSEGPSQGVPLGSSSSTADFSPAVEAMTIHIELTGAVGLSYDKISLTFLPLATIIEVKRAIVRSTEGKFFPSSLFFRSSRRNNLDTLLGLRVKDMDHFIAANQTTQSCDASLTVRSSFILSWVECFGYLLLGCSVLSVSFMICILTLLLMPLAGLHFCVGLDFVTPSLEPFLSKYHYHHHHHHHHYQCQNGIWRRRKICSLNCEEDRRCR
jgi:hypothetical protein